MLITVLIPCLFLLALLRPLKHWLFMLHMALLSLAGFTMDYLGFTHGAFTPKAIAFALAAHVMLINALVYLAYGYDKRQARRKGWRIPEKTFHALSFIGGSVGAYVGQSVFRHKTRKTSFRIVHYMITGIQVVVLCIFLWLSRGVS